MKVLVTGSSGFIGRHLVPTLVSAGHTVMGLSTTPHPPEISGSVYHQCDILDGSGLTGRFSEFQPEAVIHLAARADLDESAGLSGYAANIEGVANLCRAIAATPSVKRAIVTSTQLVCRVGYRPTSDQDYSPSTVYGQSKVRTEQIVREHDGGGATWCLIRPTTVWGPGMNAHYQRFFRMIRTGRYFHVGSTPRMRHMGYVGNVATQYLRFLEADATQIHRKVFYTADYEPISVQTWATLLQAAMKAPNIRTMPTWVAKSCARVGDLLNACGWRSFPFNTFRITNVLTEYTFDLTPTREVCGPMPFTPADGARQTADWFLSLDTPASP